MQKRTSKTKTKEWKVRLVHQFEEALTSGADEGKALKVAFSRVHLTWKNLNLKRARIIIQKAGKMKVRPYKKQRKSQGDVKAQAAVANTSGM